MTHHSFSYYQLREQLRRVQALLTKERKEVKRLKGLLAHANYIAGLHEIQERVKAFREAADI